VNIVNKLTLRHLKLNKGRTAMTILGIALSVAMVCCVAGFLLSARDLMLQTIRNDGDYHFAFYGVAPETAAQIENEYVFSTYYTTPGTEDGIQKEGTLNVYLRLRNPSRESVAAAEKAAKNYEYAGMQVNNKLLAAEGVFVLDNALFTFVVIAVTAIAIIVAGSVIVIANAFYISASERVRQFGLLKSVGATSGQLGRSVLFEAVILMMIALPIGILAGFLIQNAVLWATNNLLFEIFSLNMHNGTLAFRVILSPWIIYITVAAAVLTILISAWLPARRAAKISPIDAIRQAKDIQIKPKKMKTSRLTQRLFGFEGALASKSLKRSKGKYRATIISLTVSIVLFLSMSSLIWVLNKGVSMQFGGYDFDVLARASGGLDALDEIGGALRTIPDAQIRTIMSTQLTTVVPADFIKEGAPGAPFSGNRFPLRIYPIPDSKFSSASAASNGNIPGILINTATFSSGNKKVEMVPYNCTPGTELPLIADSTSEIGGVIISSVANTVPEQMISVMLDGTAVNVMVPESAYRAMFSEHAADLKPHTEAFYLAVTADSNAFTEEAGKLLSAITLEDGEKYTVRNIAQMTRLNRNITLIVMLFGYGFIAMLSLIALTSVIATISTNMRLRRQEFAMLYSAGMTPEGMDKMLNLESLLYGLKSLLIGLPIGLALSYMIYRAMAETMDFAYEFPWIAVTISAAAVMLLTFGTMRYSKRKLSGISIVEAIRNEAI